MPHSRRLLKLADSRLAPPLPDASGRGPGGGVETGPLAAGHDEPPLQQTINGRGRNGDFLLNPPTTNGCRLARLLTGESQPTPILERTARGWPAARGSRALAASDIISRGCKPNASRLAAALAGDFLQVATTSDVAALNDGESQPTHIDEQDGSVMPSCRDPRRSERVSAEYRGRHPPRRRLAAALSDGFVLFDDQDIHAKQSPR